MEKSIGADRESITVMGNPKKPEGDAGRIMLGRMNESHASLTAWAISLLGIDCRDSVLDIGCGGGAALSAMSAEITEGHLTGVDYSDVSVSLSAETNARDIASGKTEIIKASVDSLPFADGTFDKIISVESFYFWQSPARDLCEVSRVLKKGGRAAIALDVYTHDGMSASSRESVKKYGLYAPTAFEFEDMMRRAEFGEVRLYTEPDSDRIVALGIK